jgi:hypothetical protein
MKGIQDGIGDEYGLSVLTVGRNSSGKLNIRVT